MGSLRSRRERQHVESRGVHSAQTSGPRAHVVPVHMARGGQRPGLSQVGHVVDLDTSSRSLSVRNELLHRALHVTRYSQDRTPHNEAHIVPSLTSRESLQTVALRPSPDAFTSAINSLGSHAHIYTLPRAAFWLQHRPGWLQHRADCRAKIIYHMTFIEKASQALK